MRRKDFIRRSAIGLGSFFGLGALLALERGTPGGPEEDEACGLSPGETRGPFPNKTPADYVKENIVGDRKGIPLLMELNILNGNAGCSPLPDVWVDVWHCDSHGRYSEYGGGWMQEEDLTREHFLRGRQRSDARGQITFVTIFPGYYPGRAPHIHVEVRDPEGRSLLVTQIAFPEEVCNTVYATTDYEGTGYVANASDSVFRDSLERNMADALTGDLRNGYTLRKDLVVPA